MTFQIQTVIQNFIRSGIKVGIEDAEAGHVHQLNADYIADLQNELRQRLSKKA